MCGRDVYTGLAVGMRGKGGEKGEKGEGKGAQERRKAGPFPSSLSLSSPPLFPPSSLSLHRPSLSRVPCISRPLHPAHAYTHHSTPPPSFLSPKWVCVLHTHPHRGLQEMEGQGSKGGTYSSSGERRGHPTGDSRLNKGTPRERDNERPTRDIQGDRQINRTSNEYNKGTHNRKRDGWDGATAGARSLSPRSLPLSSQAGEGQRERQRGTEQPRGRRGRVCDSGLDWAGWMGGVSPLPPPPPAPAQHCPARHVQRRRGASAGGSADCTWVQGGWREIRRRKKGPDPAACERMQGERL